MASLAVPEETPSEKPWSESDPSGVETTAGESKGIMLLVEDNEAPKLDPYKESLQQERLTKSDGNRLPFT
jgi:hypothetical protein